MGNDALIYHNNTAFSTKDKDNDNCLDKCAQLRKGESRGLDGGVQRQGHSPAGGDRVDFQLHSQFSGFVLLCDTDPKGFRTSLLPRVSVVSEDTGALTVFHRRWILVQLLHRLQPQRRLIPPWGAQQAPGWHHLVRLARLQLLPQTSGDENPPGRLPAISRGLFWRRLGEGQRRRGRESRKERDGKWPIIFKERESFLGGQDSVLRMLKIVGGGI